MTDEEIIKRAAEIEAKKGRQQIVRHFMQSQNVQIVAFDAVGETKRLFVEKDANLAAMLCRILDVENPST